MSHIRVLHIIDSGGMYGAEVMLLNLVAEQIRQGLRPIIASIGDHHCGEKAIEAEARKRYFPVQPFRMLPGPNFIGAWKILNYAKSINCTLLHSHGYKGNILFGFIHKRIRHLPLVATVHGWTSNGTGFSLKRLYYWLDSWALSRMEAVVLVNEGMLIHPKLAGRKTINFHIVDNGISAEEPGPYSCDDLELKPGGKLNIVAVGRLSPEKGFDVLLKAMARVIEKGIDVSLVLFGEGGERRKLEELVCQLGLQERVKMPGFVESVAATFSCFDFLAMPSLSEGLPIALLEAMRAKLPVIASRVGGIPNVLGGGTAGLLVEAGSVEELAAAIAKLAGSEAICNQISREAYLAFRQKYSAAHMAAAYRQIYEDILV